MNKERILPDYSVLMSVYKNENPDFLKTAMDSMWNQSVPTDDFVLLCDGPLTPELDTVIRNMDQEHNALHVIRFPENHGLGYALQVGVRECKNELIARMDSDDISRQERCEKELRIFADHPELAIVGAVIEEFIEIEQDSFVPSAVNSKRVVPEKPEQIYTFAKMRNPFNHPSVMFKKSAVLFAGNYSDVRYLQDYYLWAHMLIAGFKGYNIQESLVFMRADDNLFRRRSGRLYRDLQLNLFRYMKEQGFITNTQYVKSCALRTASSMAPNWLRRFVFQKVLRK